MWSPHDWHWVENVMPFSKIQVRLKSTWPNSVSNPDVQSLILYLKIITLFFFFITVKVMLQKFDTSCIEKAIDSGIYHFYYFYHFSFSEFHCNWFWKRKWFFIDQNLILPFWVKKAHMKCPNNIKTIIWIIVLYLEWKLKHVFLW